MRFGFDAKKPPASMGQIKSDTLPSKYFPLKDEIKGFLNPNITDFAGSVWNVTDQTDKGWNPKNAEDTAADVWGTWSTGPWTCFLQLGCVSNAVCPP